MKTCSDHWERKSRSLELILPAYNLTVMIQEPNYCIKVTSQICPREARLKIFFLFFCFASHFCSFYTLSLPKSLDSLRIKLPRKIDQEKCLKRQSGIGRRQAGSHLQTDKMENLRPGVSYMI